MRARRWVATVVALLAAASATAWELDGSTSGRFTANDDARSAGSTTSLAIDRRLSQDGLVRIVGSAAFESSAGGAPSVEIFLDEAFWTDTWTAGGAGARALEVVTLTVGRFPVGEATGLAAPFSADGLGVQWKRPGLVVDALAVTTALLPATRGLTLTNADADDVAGAGTRPLADGSLIAAGPFPPGAAPDRFVGGLIIALPEQVGLANLTAQYLAQVDARRLVGAEPGEDTLSVNYTSGVVSLPLGRLLFATGSVTGAFGRYGAAGGDDVPLRAMLAFGELRGYVETLVRPTGSLSLVWASGSDGTGPLPAAAGRSTVFPPGLFAPRWRLAPVGLRNVIAGSASGTLLPLAGAGELVEDTLLGLGVIGLFKPAAGSSSSQEISDPGLTGWYGVELDASVTVRPFYDLEISGAGAIFLPVASENGGVLAAGTERSWQIEITARLLW